MTPVGFSHSEISGSKPVCDSPELIAANYVLHRHLTPRHPSCALSSLTANLLWIAPRKVGWSATINYRDTPSQIVPHRWVSIPTPSQTVVWRMRFKVEIEARLTNSELWIPSTLVFILSRHAFASLSCYSVVKELQSLSTADPIASVEATTSMFEAKVFSIRWSVRGSNPRPPACKAGALPAELTPQKVLGLPRVTPPDAVGLERFELSTPRLSSVCSNQLSYRPRLKVSMSAAGRTPRRASVPQS